MARNIRGEAKVSRAPSGVVAEKIYAWPVVGTTRVAGASAKYTVLLWSNGELSCDCPGWIFYHKKNGGCKHTSSIKGESQDIHKMWKDGRELPMIVQSEDPAVAGIRRARLQTTPTASDPDSKIRFGRFIEID